MGTPAWCVASASLPVGSGWCQVRILSPNPDIPVTLSTAGLAPVLDLVPVSPHAMSPQGSGQAGCHPVCFESQGSHKQSGAGEPASPSTGARLWGTPGQEAGIIPGSPQPAACVPQPTAQRVTSRKLRGVFSSRSWDPTQEPESLPLSSGESEAGGASAEPRAPAGGWGWRADGSLTAHRGTCAFYSPGAFQAASSRWPRCRSVAQRGIPGSELGKCLSSGVKNNPTSRGHARAAGYLLPLRLPTDKPARGAACSWTCLPASPN